MTAKKISSLQEAHIFYRWIKPEDKIEVDKIRPEAIQFWISTLEPKIGVYMLIPPHTLEFDIPQQFLTEWEEYKAEIKCVKSITCSIEKQQFMQFKQLYKKKKKGMHQFMKEILKEKINNKEFPVVILSPQAAKREDVYNITFYIEVNLYKKLESLCGFKKEKINQFIIGHIQQLITN